MNTITFIIWVLFFPIETKGIYYSHFFGSSSCNGTMKLVFLFHSARRESSCSSVFQFGVMDCIFTAKNNKTTKNDVLPKKAYLQNKIFFKAIYNGLVTKCNLAST